MNPTHLHLVLNHIPVLGPMFALGLLLFAFWRRSEDLKRGALGVATIAALAAIPAYMTGEPAEHTAERLPGVSESLIERHETSAAIALTGTLLLGALGATGLIRRRGRHPAPGWFNASLIVTLLTVNFLMAWTANLGGQIRHTEIRANASYRGASERDQARRERHHERREHDDD